MKLHIMASLRTHFTLNDEEVHAAPEQYRSFWATAEERSEKIRQAGLRSIRFMHKKQLQNCELSRFRTVSTDSLSRPLHVIEIEISPEDELLETIENDVGAKFAEAGNCLDQVTLLKESVNVRIYNNCVALLQADVDIDEFINKLPAGQIARHLDSLQEFAVTLGEQLAQRIYRQSLYQYLSALLASHNGRHFISAEHFKFGFALENAILTETSHESSQCIRVNWVTRTLLVETEDKNNLSAIIEHWLKDCGNKELIQSVKKESGAHAIRWLNYLFRESAWSWKTKQGANACPAVTDYSTPFADEWQAMLNAQYYYATFESLNDSLTSILAKSYRKQTVSSFSNSSALRELSRDLERHAITANLAMLEYHNNFGYYKRYVGETMRSIMKGWDFEEAILSEIKRKTELCEQRIDELHKKAESVSGFYSDLLLLGIALISVSAFLFQLIEYGRTMSHNADLAVYESNSWNVIQFISERPTDFIITLSLALIVLLFGLYALFRRTKVIN